MLTDIITWIVDTVNTWGYFGIFAAMFLESSFFPFPSEVIMVPAGYLAFQDKMNLPLAIFIGTAGSVAGALFNYYLAVWLGRPFLLKYGRHFWLKEETLEKLEKFFEKHGEISTFNGRLIPGIRQYISLPAGLSKMHVGRFALFTALGAGLWVTVLALLGYFLGAHQDLMRQYLHQITLATLAVVLIGTLLYYRHHKKREVS